MWFSLSDLSPVAQIHRQFEIFCLLTLAKILIEFFQTRGYGLVAFSGKRKPINILLNYVVEEIWWNWFRSRSGSKFDKVLRIGLLCELKG